MVGHEEKCCNEGVTGLLSLSLSLSLAFDVSTVVTVNI